MAKKIYIGNMLQEMQSAISDLQTDMGTMSTDMASMVSELIALKTTMGQGISAINVAGSDTPRSTTDTDILIAYIGTSAYKDFIKYQVLANGSVKIAGTLRFTSIGAGYNTKIGYSLNGGAWVEISTISPGAGTIDLAFNKVITISYGAEIKVGAWTDNNGKHNNHILLAGLTVGYDILDLVNDGAIVVI